MTVSEIALEVCDLLQQQLDMITAKRFADLKPEEQEIYTRRTQRIAELRAELQRFISPV